MSPSPLSILSQVGHPSLLLVICSTTNPRLSPLASHLLYIQIIQRASTNNCKDSNPAVPAQNGDHDEPNEDMKLSSCSRRSYIPTPYNSPIARNPRQRSPNGIPSTRLRGGGPKRFAGSPITPAAKKSKVILNGRGNKKDRMYNDAEAVLADGNSPLYDDADVTVSPNSQYRKTKAYRFGRPFFSTRLP